MLSPDKSQQQAVYPLVRRTWRTSQVGLTLVELLISIAIMVLIAFLLIRVLRPNDDQRCKLEAQRLAFFLEKASNESKMRAGAVRVHFVFQKQGLAEMKVAELSVASTQMTWNSSEDRPHEVEAPVLLTELETHLSGIVKEGDQGFILFNNGATAGGVARLSLNQIVYSVIVPNQGEPPYIERGRGELPLLPKAQQRLAEHMGSSEMPTLPSSGQGASQDTPTPRSSGNSWGNPSASPPALPSSPPTSVPPSSPPPLPAEPIQDPPLPSEDEQDPICGDGKVDEGEECDDGNDDEQDACLNSCEEARCGDGIIRLDLPVDRGGEDCDDGDDNDQNACTNQCKSATCGDGILREDLDPRDEGYEECDDGNLSAGDGCSAICQTECSTDLDCQDPEEKGPWGACDLDSRTCSLRFPAFRLASITSVGVTDGGLTLNPDQPALAIELQASLQSWINSGKLLLIVSLGEFGQIYEYAHQAPTAYFFQGQLGGVNHLMSRQDLPVYRYEPSYQDCSVNGVFDHCYTSGKAVISLYIPLFGTESCDYQVLTLNTQLTVSAKPSQRAQVTLTGYLTPRDARVFMLADSLSLADALDRIEPTVDCNGDPKKEAWAITITAEATESELVAPPIGSAPPGCPQGGGGDDCNPPPDDAEIQGLLDASCVRCHSESNSSAELSLESPFRDKVVQLPSTTQNGLSLVEPRDYQNSVLYLKAGEAHGGNRAVFSPSSLTRLKDWILGL